MSENLIPIPIRLRDELNPNFYSYRELNGALNKAFLTKGFELGGICKPLEIDSTSFFINDTGKLKMAAQNIETPTKKVKAEKFNTIGVRFPEEPGTEYTYKVRIGAKPYLGQELIADTPRGQAVVFVTRIDKKPAAADSTYYSQSSRKYVGMKYIDRKAVAL